jgi:hypothetical protein
VGDIEYLFDRHGWLAISVGLPKLVNEGDEVSEFTDAVALVNGTEVLYRFISEVDKQGETEKC